MDDISSIDWSKSNSGAGTSYEITKLLAPTEVRYWRFRAKYGEWLDVNVRGINDSSLVPIGTISGLVRTADEKGVADLSICFSSPTKAQNCDAKTDVTGKFMLGPWFADTYTISPSSPTGEYSFEPSSQKEVRLSKEEASIKGIDFIASSKEPVIEVYAISGSVYDPEGIGVAGISICFSSSEQAENCDAKTDADGKFTLEDLPDGTYTVFPKGDYTFSSQKVQISGAPVEGIDFTASKESGDVSISGSVHDHEGVGVAGISICFSSSNQAENCDAKTDADGKFTLEYLPDGTYTVFPKGDYMFDPISEEVVLSGTSVEIHFTTEYLPLVIEGVVTFDIATGTLIMPWAIIDLRMAGLPVFQDTQLFFDFSNDTWQPIEWTVDDPSLADKLNKTCPNVALFDGTTSLLTIPWIVLDSTVVYKNVTLYLGNDGTLQLLVGDIQLSDFESLNKAKEGCLGDVFRDHLQDGTEGPEMVGVPAGQFRMGDIQEAGEPDEQPVHDVSINRFAIGRYEVTFADYDRFADATGRTKPDDRSFGRDDRPVMNISSQDATDYVEWLSQETGKQYRLPTEAEWEYVARAGTETQYWWGNEIGSDNAHCDSCGSHLDMTQTAPVGSFAANLFALYDTAGNIWEWTCSVYEEQYQGQELTCADKEVDSPRTFRGGAWIVDGFERLRSANRGVEGPALDEKRIGFRVVRDMNPAN